jgi:tripartite ATP-independent transporter DctM subunit
MSGMMLLIGLFLFSIGVPIAFALGLAVAIPLTVTQMMPLTLVVQRMYVGADSFLLLAIPFFMAAGNIMNCGGLTRRIFKFATGIVGWLPGGLGHVNILASMLFAGMSGSAVADTAGLGPIELQAMEEDGYDKDFSTGVTLASSVIGPIIPPSIPMVVYGGLTQVSIAALFVGGIIPGCVMAVSLMIIVYLMSVKRNYPRHRLPAARVFWKSFWDAIPALLTPVIILGGIISGFFTPTEASAIAVIYATLVGAFYYKELKFSDLKVILKNTCIDTAAIMLIVAAASAIGWVVAFEDIPQIICQSISAVTSNPYVILLLINIFLLTLGCFMDATAIQVIFTPVLYPLVISLGINPVHFGVMMVINVMVGLLTPPFGLLLFVGSKVSKLSVHVVIKAVCPFLIPLFIVLVMLTYIPEFVTFLPRLLHYIP